MASDPVAFGKYLRAKRKAARMSQTEVGELLGMTHAYLSEVERGARPPLRREHWEALAAGVPGITIADLERAAALTRSLAIDLSDAPAGYVEAALALAARVRARDLSSAELPKLLALLESGSVPAVRAHGRVVDAGGRPVVGQAFVYRLASDADWVGLVGAREHASRTAGPFVGRLALLTGTKVDLVAASAGRGAGSFDLPGGLPPGEYALDVHHDGGQEWAWPLTVTDGVASQDVRIGGSGAARSSASRARPAPRRSAPPRRAR